MTILTAHSFTAHSIMVYDWNEVDNCIERHYALLVEAAYFDPSASDILQKEKDQLAFDVLRAFGISERMIDLLRHLLHQTARR